jgi:hypothetical protein
MDGCKKQLKGWGIWMETMEITEVQILSNSVSYDLQTEFRETQNLQASQNKMDAEHEVRVNQRKVNFETNKRAQDTKEKKEVDKSAQSVESSKRELEKFKKDNKNNLTRHRISNDENFAAQRRANEIQRQNFKTQFENDKQNADIYVTQKQRELEVQRKKEEQAIAELNKETDLLRLEHQ